MNRRTGCKPHKAGAQPEETEVDAELVRRARQALEDPGASEPVEDVIRRMRARRYEP